MTTNHPDLRIAPPVDYDTRPNLSLGEQHRNRRVAVACIILAVLTAVYFIAQLSRGA